MYKMDPYIDEAETVLDCCRDWLKVEHEGLYRDPHCT